MNNQTHIIPINGVGYAAHKEVYDEWERLMGVECELKNVTRLADYQRVSLRQVRFITREEITAAMWHVLAIALPFIAIADWRRQYYWDFALDVALFGIAAWSARRRWFYVGNADV